MEENYNFSKGGSILNDDGGSILFYDLQRACLFLLSQAAYLAELKFQDKITNGVVQEVLKNFKHCQLRNSKQLYPELQQNYNLIKENPGLSPKELYLKAENGKSMSTFYRKLKILGIIQDHA